MFLGSTVYNGKNTASILPKTEEPVFISGNTQLDVRAQITQLKVVITRQDGETVLEGEAWCYTLKPESLDER